MKVLIIASYLKKHILVFHMPYLKAFKKMGYEVHVASKNDYGKNYEEKLSDCDYFFDINFHRNPFNPINVLALFSLIKIIKDNDYDIIHCHTPIGGFLGRLASKFAGKKHKIIYTAHGLHFYKNAPIKNWIMYYPIERLLSRFTDVLITINVEDYSFSRKKLKAKETYYIPGVGIDVSKYSGKKADFYRQSIGLSKDVFLMMSVGELNKNKNHEVIIKALARLHESSIHYIICGEGKLKKQLEKLSKRLNVYKQVHFLGYRNDLHNIYQISDLFVFPSYREGLSLSLMEAMASALPVICSDIRGNNDLVVNGMGGYLSNPKDEEGFSKQIKYLLENHIERKKFGLYNFNRIDAFSLENVVPKVIEIYKKISMEDIKCQK